MNEETCAVLLEVIQGEGGVRSVPADVLAAARQACDRHNALLIIDEVQTGMGRTGPWFAWQATDVVPDVMTVAKALANGLPIGACIARGSAASALGLGDHATTFGGNPVTCAAAVAVIDTLDGAVRLDALQRGEQLADGLMRLVDDGLATGVRGAGLLRGLVLGSDSAAAVERACDARWLVVNAVAPHVIRLAPPLTVTSDEIATALDVLRAALIDVSTGSDT